MRFCTHKLASRLNECQAGRLAIIAPTERFMHPPRLPRCITTSLVTKVIWLPVMYQGLDQEARRDIMLMPGERMSGV